jgi:8-oxo-dGTP pyrophosphatase MutT (NUDIX family)
VETGVPAKSPADAGRPLRIPDDLARRLVPVEAPVPDAGGLRYAAVLAVLVPGGPLRAEGVRIVLIERAAMLRTHAGQLAFPGGKPEPHDVSLADTALREAEEEVGLDRRAPEVLGRLHPVPTPSGFMIVPYVAWAPPGWLPEPTSPEVGRVLTPQLARLADPQVHRIAGVRDWNGHRYELHEFAIHEPALWGATARMMWDLLERMRGPSSCPPPPS